MHFTAPVLFIACSIYLFGESQNQICKKVACIFPFSLIVLKIVDRQCVQFKLDVSMFINECHSNVNISAFHRSYRGKNTRDFRFDKFSVSVWKFLICFFIRSFFNESHIQILKWPENISFNYFIIMKFKIYSFVSISGYPLKYLSLLFLYK